MVQVDIPGLTAVGAAVERAAAAFDAVPRDGLGEAGHLTAWATGPALTAAAAAWQDFLDQLAGQVRDLGGDLSAAARRYGAADEAAAARAAAAGDGIPAGHPARGRVSGR